MTISVEPVLFHQCHNWNRWNVFPVFILKVVRWALLLGIASGQAWACVCGAYPSVKQAWEGSPVVMVGYVENADPNSQSLQSAITAQTVTVRAGESFKGSREGQTFVLKQPDHDCAPKFKVGQRQP